MRKAFILISNALPIANFNGALPSLWHGFCFAAAASPISAPAYIRRGLYAPSLLFASASIGFTTNPSFPGTSLPFFSPSFPTPHDTSPHYTSSGGRFLDGFTTRHLATLRVADGFEHDTTLHYTSLGGRNSGRFRRHFQVKERTPKGPRFRGTLVREPLHTRRKVLRRRAKGR